MKYVFNILLLLLIVGLSYLLYSSIKEPIAFGTAKDARISTVTNKLKKIRTAQEVYRGITGKFASTFDSLSYVLKNGNIEFVKLTEDPEDPTNPDKFIRTVTYKPAIDSMRSLGITGLDSLKYIPYTNGEEFFLSADTLTYQQTLVSVMEAGTIYSKFMGEYADPKYMKYDGSYDPKATIKFGDLTKPSLSGNWE